MGDDRVMERWSSEQPLAVVAAGALVATLLVWGVLERGWYSADAGGDIALYQTYGDRIVDGHAVPYRDFAIEYPPADLPVFALPSLAKSLGYRNVFRALMALCAASTVAAVFLAGGGRAAGWAALAPIALGSLA